ncbi:MAG: hypothetical protein OHK0021_11480 [Bryobacter sp.]|nr:hypothetical protein [Bryobacter sp.]
MADTSKTNIEALAAAIYPEMASDERAALVRVWSAAAARLEPLKQQLRPTVDPDARFNPLPD